MKHNLKVILLMLLDVVVFVGAWILSWIILRLNVVNGLSASWVYLVAGALLVLGLNIAFKIYSILLSYASFSAALKLLCVIAIIGIYNLVVSAILGGAEMVKEWAIILTSLYLVYLMFSRFIVRIINILKATKGSTVEKASRVMVIGAGSAGSMIIKEMQSSPRHNLIPVCAIDDDKEKLFKYINNVKVVGDTSKIVENANKYSVDQIIIAIPSANKTDLRRIVDECQKTNCQLKIIPSMFQFTNGNISVKDIKSVSINDLLGREQVKVNLKEITGYIKNKVVLVTGGGGSIGSELCRQIASNKPKQLIILDIYENNAYEIEQELVRKVPNLNMLVLIASVRDKKKIDSIFSVYKPDIVFHAAAHKHVPLMETSPNEAVKNNVGGTLNVAKASSKYGVEKFILISTDKAVNPTNVMGATKRICEMIIQSMDKKSKTDFVAVRFGNVLGSNGSVIPLFTKQIKEGGPITVTHKDIVRYFMTIPEAVSLVLQAGAFANGGEIFVLDMGEPVKIYDLAVNMIKLSGLVPFEDISIKITGLRPGEKLYEERLMAEEGLQKTANEKISIGKPLDIDCDSLFNKIDLLLDSANRETSNMKDLVKELVPTYIIDRR
jgi:FlaA1/EpsC-like NDP-sugar epimerase